MSELAVLGGESAVTIERPLWPHIGEPETRDLHEAIKISQTDISYLDSMPAGGPIAMLEAHIGKYLSRRYAVSSNSCTAAIQMALYAAGVGAGDEVVVSPYTWPQTVSPVLHQLGTPVFADIDPDSFTMRPDTVEAAITERTKAILVVHIYGHPADMDPIVEIGRRHGLPVIEDCAQAMGAFYHGREVGTLGDLACFSFGNGKQIIGGDGGCVVTDDAAMWQRLIEIGSHQRRQERDISDPEVARYMNNLTYTFRMHPMAAVIVNRQLDFLAEWNLKRRSNHHRLSDGLSDIPCVKPVVEVEGAEHCYHKYCPSFVPEEAEGLTREAFVDAVAAEGVQITLGYVRTPIHLRERFQERHYFYGKGMPWALNAHSSDMYKTGDCPVAEARCATSELEVMGAAALRGDQSALIDQYLDAFHKVWEQRDALIGR